MNKVATIYKVIRGVLFTTVILLVVTFLAVYLLLSAPTFQKFIKGEIEKEAGKFLNTKVEISDLTVKPFNEVVLSNVRIFDLSGRECVSVESLGAGISLWRLIKDGRVILTYGEIIGLHASVVQQREDEPLNIGFLIDAFKSKDKNKPPSKFSMRLYNVVMRNCGLSFDRNWIARDSNEDKTDFNHFKLTDLRADIACPRISQEDVKVDLRRLAFSVSGGLELEKLACKVFYTPRELTVKDFNLKLPGTEIKPNDLTFSYADPSDLVRSILDGGMTLRLNENRISLSDFGWLLPDLRRFSVPWSLTLDASGARQFVELTQLSLVRDDGRFNLFITGALSNLDSLKNMEADIAAMRLTVGEGELSDMLASFPINMGKGKTILEKTGRMVVDINGKAIPGRGDYRGEVSISDSRLGSFSLKGEAAGVKRGRGDLKGELVLHNIEAGIIGGLPQLGEVTGNASFNGLLHGKDIDGYAEVNIESLRLGGSLYDGLRASVRKNGRDCEADLFSDSDLAYADVNAFMHIDGDESSLDINADIKEAHPGKIFPSHGLDGSAVAFRLQTSLVGKELESVQGDLKVSGFEFQSPGKGTLSLFNLAVHSETVDSVRRLNLNSDWIDGSVTGNFRMKDLIGELRRMASQVVPALVTAPSTRSKECDMTFDFTIKPDNSWTEFLNLPFRLLVPVPMGGSLDSETGMVTAGVTVPYLQQGKNKLIRDTYLKLQLNGNEGRAAVEGTTTFPGKKGDMSLAWNIHGCDNNIDGELRLKSLEQSFLSGAISLATELKRNDITGKPDVVVAIKPSTLGFGKEDWKINPATISFVNGVLTLDSLRIDHGEQFVKIDGVASASPTDSVKVRLASVDIGYIFDTLNINYVSFSGVATGDVSASGVFGQEPRALTDRLFVKDLSYNGAVLGDAVLKSMWNNREKEVTILADIAGNRGRQRVDGGIWVTRDSLSFAIDADKVPVEFMKPFVSAFSSDLRGYASGRAKLFGSFSDIDLVGDILADSLALKLDYTNVWYHGSDSVRLRPGHITIPSFRLYDDEGRSAILTGDLTHRYFHDPKFNFRVSDARGLLCYNTNAFMNPDWYGRIYGNGGAVIKGWPGVVSVSVDMSATGNSSFTFVLNDTEAAEDYRFLTFSDKKKEEKERLNADTVPQVLASFMKKVTRQNDVPSKFMLDIRGSVTPSTLFTLVMDPIAGDKITARGNGNLQVDYDSESNDMKMFGKYVLEEGNYNFSLQDLFLRDFTIRRGSSISFNGDPLNALLDITAAYRVNTNLSDLDKSFSTDRELARTSVPVDALLMVDGEMQHPDITFDIQLPTLTQDVERKVKSIISTEDMMSRQIIYLLALQRFYTPEYMGSSSNGSEFAAVASSTLSSQLTNMLGQLTDKFTLAPTFRSDKGDFSDLEVDVALSSRLLNNRLLINGNFGYRDKSTSTTTFVGDFDIEYLLSRNGNLRLKAYNHFNDQNYYLRQALTTQGLGVIYRKDFDNPFTFLRRRKKESTNKNEVTDTRITE